PTRPRVIALDPETLEDTHADARTLGEATGRSAQGARLVAQAAARIDAVRAAVRGRPRPRVLALELLDPAYVAGHWTPQMIELAGGEDAAGRPGEPSYMVGWEELQSLAPEVVIVMPCGYDAPRAHAEALEHRGSLALLRAVAIAGADHGRGEGAPDQPADVAAPGDVGEREGDHEVDEDEATYAALHHWNLSCAHLNGGGAHDPEHGPRGAHRERVGRDEQRTERPGEQRDGIHDAELQAAERGLEHLSKHVQDIHVEADVEQVLVQEAAGDDPPQLAMGDALAG